MGRKCIFSGLLGLLAVILYYAAGSAIPALDKRADSYFTNTATEAALAYATVRGVNAVVSVIKESAVDVSPAGVGLTIAVGQILDPIDDLTERLSSILVTALAALGLQKLVMILGKELPLSILSIVILLLIIPVWLTGDKRTYVLTRLMKLVVILVVLRVLMPVSALLSEGVYQSLLKNDIIAAKNQLNALSNGQEKLAGFGEPHQTGIIATFSQSAKETIEQARVLYQRITEQSETIVAALLKLTTLYVSLFILQVIIIPLGTLWLLITLANSLFTEYRPAGGASPTASPKT